MSKVIELDVRELPVPEPIAAALSALVHLKEGEIIHFWHRMKPDMLMPRLNDYYFEIKEEDEVHLYICKKDDEASIATIKAMMEN
ncbi:MAG: hypothetical protein COA44_05605 [Arcobacter sp.]|nr:MAG: hypothetical protein COA44_05605 [Arcobacter sp.]